jgi:A/G-specific adenine glycosylase
LDSRSLNYAAVRRKLAQWYDKHHRDLPWRRTNDPYAIWISEIMLQQTRVVTVIPYWERFLEAFPDFHALAAAPEEEVLKKWAGLGYYSRAHNIQKAARQMAKLGKFPENYESIRNLAGVGDYTAAAVTSIAFGLPFAAVDGNVRRVLVRLLNSPEANVHTEAGRLLDRKNPSRFNQSMMELGAVVCLPRGPLCAQCPVRTLCLAHKAGTQAAIPPPNQRPQTKRIRIDLVLIRHNDSVFLIPSSRVKGFWDLPETRMPVVGAADLGRKLGMFRHAIMDRLYLFEVYEATFKGKAKLREGARWVPMDRLEEIPLSTAARKALSCLKSLKGMG